MRANYLFFYVIFVWNEKLVCFKQNRMMGWVGIVVSFIPFHLGPRFKFKFCVDWVFNLYLTAWVFPEIILCGFPPTSVTDLSICIMPVQVIGGCTG